ncbi:MAG: PfkB family carbohydrate kinase [Gaiellales bacterium]
MRRLGVVGLTGLDLVDGGPLRVGGAAYYAARALRFLGHPAVVATKFAERDRAAVAPLFRLGIPVEAGPASSTISFRIDNEGDRRRMAIESLGDPWTPEEARGWVARALAGADYVHAGALTGADFSPETLATLANGRILSFDGQGLVRRARMGKLVLDTDFDRELLRHVDILKLGEEEADALGVGHDERSLGSLGVREVVLTLGRRGAILYADGLAEHVPTRPLDGVDPTGAGDQFITAYVSYRRLGHAPPSAARCATDAVFALLAGWPGR